MITFKEWFDKWLPNSTSPETGLYSEEDMLSAFNAGRTQGHPRVWRYKKVKGRWMVEFLDKAPVESGPVEET